MSTEAVNVIEVRACANGYVITAWMAVPNARDHFPLHGYETHVIEGSDPDKVGRAVADVIRAHPITRDVSIPPARALP